MALIINDLCTCCDACVHLCPNDAICAEQPYYLIDSNACTECLGDFAEAQCAAICPIEGAIVDETGAPLNPPGSLTGIPPHKLASLQLTEPPSPG